MESDSAWAGFGSDYLEALNNEYPKITTWTWGIESQAVHPVTMILIEGECQEETHICGNDGFSIREYISLYPSCSTTSYAILHLYRNFLVLAYIRVIYPALRLDHRPQQNSARTSISYGHAWFRRSSKYPRPPQDHKPRRRRPLRETATEWLDGFRVAWSSWRKTNNGNSDKRTSRWYRRVDCEAESREYCVGTVYEGIFITDFRILHPQLLPLPTSFPKIFPHNHAATSLSTFSSLSSNPKTITSRLKEAARDAQHLESSQDREQLVNTLDEISSYFEEDDDLE